MYNYLFNLGRKLNLGFIFLAIHPSSALKKIGWFRSFRSRVVNDNKGNSIPWWTYSFIDFLEPRLNKNLRVLEFGCGNSSIYLSNRVKEVVAIEDYQDWAEEIRTKINSNSKIIKVNSIPEFEEYKSNIIGKFDVLIIDNLGDRIATAKNGIPFLNDYGVVIWDNTDGPDWPIIKKMMVDLGFKEISFTGMIPQELNLSKTTLFYRKDNCLGI
ncbi:hypothetical protein E4S40_01800 [Algoriphagus kandeliae]|uniref:Class I SAM-dependent methyltransferase n=1 Tax=Algoriphagus kandeliae TaxID=2562278 RepID=A0A4Y9QY59_9BACT|nr:hypothetical protein [Algoriphagus kandeliae]TFV97414.1 hypothetical protein E4S40_01800 [Algoriphagus kandeliae]